MWPVRHAGLDSRTFDSATEHAVGGNAEAVQCYKPWHCFRLLMHLSWVVPVCFVCRASGPGSGRANVARCIALEAAPDCHSSNKHACSSWQQCASGRGSVLLLLEVSIRVWWAWAGCARLCALLWSALYRSGDMPLWFPTSQGL